MAHSPLVVPRTRVCAWFGEEPEDPRLRAGQAPHLEMTSGPADVAFVDPMLRRRLSPMARGFFHCAQRLSPPGDVRLVFASRHGEADRTLGVLQELAAEREVSPSAFSMSVHNAIPGLWSIFKGNHAPCAALAAGPGTFAWGLVEAAAAWLEDPSAPVLCVYAEDRLPEPWAQGAPQEALHVVALLLGGEEGRTLSIRREAAGEGDPICDGLQSHHFLNQWMGDRTPWCGGAERWFWQCD